MEQANHQPLCSPMPPTSDEAMTPPTEGVPNASPPKKHLTLSLTAQRYKSIMQAHFRLFGPDRFLGGSDLEAEIATRLFHSLKSSEAGSVVFVKLPRGGKIPGYEVDDDTALKKIRQDLNRRKETYPGWRNEKGLDDSSLLVVTREEFKELKKHYAQGDVLEGEAFDMTVDTTMIECTSSVGLEVLDRLNHERENQSKSPASGDGTGNANRVESNEQVLLIVHDQSSTVPSSKSVAVTTPSAKTSDAENASPNAEVSKLPMNVPSNGCSSKKTHFPLEAMLAESSTTIRVRVNLPKKARRVPPSKEFTPKAIKNYSRKTPGRPRTKFVTPSASASNDKFLCTSHIKRAAFQHACSGIKSSYVIEGEVDIFDEANLERGAGLSETLTGQSSNEEVKPPKIRGPGRPRKHPISSDVNQTVATSLDRTDETGRPKKKRRYMRKKTKLSIESSLESDGHSIPKAIDADPAEVPFSVGDRVEALYKGTGADYYKGVIKAVHPENFFDLDYDDGDTEERLSGDYIRRLPMDTDGSSLKSDGALLGHQVAVSPETAGDNDTVANPILFEHPLDNIVYANADSMYDALWLSKSDMFAVVDKDVIVPASIDNGWTRPEPVAQISTGNSQTPVCTERNTIMLAQNVELRTNYFSPIRLPQSSSEHERSVSTDYSNAIPIDFSTSIDVAPTSTGDSRTPVRTKRLSFMPTTNVELQTNYFSPFRPVQPSSDHQPFAPICHSVEEVNAIPMDFATPSKEQCDASMVEFSWRSTASYHPGDEIVTADLPSLDVDSLVIHPSENTGEVGTTP